MTRKRLRLVQRRTAYRNQWFEESQLWGASYKSTAVLRSRTPTASSGSPSASSKTKKAGHDVCVVVSAMGDTTDELIDLAEQVSPLPAGRELDMLLTAGERIAIALLAMAIANSGYEARSFTGAQAGVITDVRRTARRASSTSRRAGSEGALGEGDDRDRGRFPGRRPGHQGHHHARPRRLRHHRGRAGRRAGGRGTARSTPTWTACSPRTRASCRPRSRSRSDHLRRDARDGCLRRQGAAPALRRVRAALQRPYPCAFVLLAEARAPGSSNDEGTGPDGTGDHLRRGA